jgi:2-polyprenyl-6-methoxyphenol hydroxylase-like FAD-dependent oxidoreductase
MSKNYDVIVVGARCAGSPLAMLLARKGYRVLVVDRAKFPSDTCSTHVLHPGAVAALRRWGLLERLESTGCPAIHTYAFDFGPFTISGSPGTSESPVAYCPRRTILDKLLVDAAVLAGAQVREGYGVEEVVLEGGRVVGVRGQSEGGSLSTERASIVVGADGRHSRIAEAVGPERYNEKPPLLAAYYAYYRGLPMDGRFETFIRPRCGFAAVPTHDDLTLVIAGWPHAEFESNRKDIEGNFQRVLGLAPSFAERFRNATRESRFSGASVPGFFRKPYGPGYALVGDAGYTKDPITAQGIQDAFRDAELCAKALDETLRGGRAEGDAMADYQRTRDEHVLAMYDFTCQLASLEPPPPDLQKLLGAMHGNKSAMDAFVQTNAGTISPAAFFSPANIERILSAAPAA